MMIENIGGNFNARTKEMGGWWEGKDKRGEEEGKKSRDKKVNKERRYLTGRLEEIGWFIFNGCDKGVRREHRHARGRGEWVVNYVLEDRQTWDRIERIEVKDRIDLDHFPIEVWLRGEIKGSGKKGSKKRKRWEWMEEGKTMFMEKMEK